MKKLLLVPLLAASLLLQACAALPALLGATMGPPPQAPMAVQAISRNALTFALHSFDAALYGLDFAMDSGRLTPGSDNARRIAAAGRQVMNFLGAADAAQRLGHSASYEDAFANANIALDEFRQLLGVRPAALMTGDLRPPLTNAQRSAILNRLDGGHPAV